MLPPSPPPSPIHGHFATSPAAPAYLPRISGSTPALTPTAPLTISRFKARQRILDALGLAHADLTPQQQTALDDLNDTVALNDLAALTAQVSEGRLNTTIIPLEETAP
jgi:hypothetical protein